MYNMLRGKNEGLLDNAIDFASRLVRIASPSLHEQQAADAVEHEMTALGYDQVFRDKAGNVIGVLHGRDPNPAMLLCSHMDAVSTHDNDAWADPPFSGTVRDGMLYGRGACDCKAGLAAQVYAGALLKRSLLPLQGTLIVAATVAEENGLSMGTRVLMTETLPSLGYKPDFVVLGEPTGLGLYYGHDGWMEINLKLEGATMFNTEDAANLVKTQIRTDYTESGSSDYELAHHEMNTGKQVLIRLKRRLNGMEETGAVVDRLEQRAAVAARSAGAVAVSGFLRRETQNMYTGKPVNALHMVKAWTTDPFHPMIERARHSLSAAGCAFKPDKWKLRNLGMGTAGSVLLNEFGIPVIGYGPGAEEMAHAVNECVPLKNIEEAIYGTAVMAHGIVGIPVFGWTLDEI